VPIAIATDHNPGTSPVRAPSLMLQMACTLFRLTPEEALRGMTVNAARALGLARTHGALRAGMRADFAVWDVGHPRVLAYWVGETRPRAVVHGGTAR
jgi:imidazolonepropionase